MAAKTILIVEDEPPMRDAIRNVLELEGYRVMTADDGQYGIDILQKNVRPCLILLDIIMPRMDGLDFLTRIKDDPAMASIPVVIVTAYGEKGKPGDTVALIKKPFRLETLLNAVQRHCA